MLIDTSGFVADALALGALPLDSPEAREYLAGVQCVYTDLDGTIFARGGVLLANAAGEPCGNGAMAFASVQAAGIEVVVDTGRSAKVSGEIMRMLNVHTFIGEMGAEIRRSWLSDDACEYCLGEWDFKPSHEGETPLDAIIASGVTDALIQAWPEQLVWHVPYSNARRVVALLCGYIDDLEKAQALVDSFPIPLLVLDNGVTASRNIVLDTCPEMRSYHIVPKGVSKGVALEADLKIKGLDPDLVLAIGDAPADAYMGDYAGAVVIPGTSAANPQMRLAIQDLAGRGRRVFVGTQPGCDIWPEMARILLEVKGVPINL